MHVGIAGAGIAGLTLALALGQRGIRTTIFERANRLEEVGAGIQLSPNASRLLIGLGLSSDLNATASAPRTIDVLSGQSGKRITSIPLGATAEKRYGAPYLVIHRGDLQAVLLRACKKNPAVEIRLGTAVERLSADDGPITFGRDKFDWFVAADGVHSALRQQITDRKAVDTGLVAWRATMPMDARPETFERASTTLCLGPNAHLVTYPVASGTLLNAVAITRGAPDQHVLHHSFKSWNRTIASVFLRADEWLPWPLRAVPDLKTWRHGRLILIGDAAHAMLPFAAQGGAMAIEDAASLAQALASGGAEPALEKWEQQRRTRTAKVAALARSNQSIYHLPFPAALARDTVMRLSGGEKLLARQDWIYGYGSN